LGYRLTTLVAATEDLAETGEIVPGGVTIDHPHRDTGVTLLMLAAAKGLVPQSTRLMAMGANPDARAVNGWQAMDFARHFRATGAAEVLAEADPDAELCAQYQVRVTAMLVVAPTLTHPHQLAYPLS
jgi:hypothetical protein